MHHTHQFYLQKISYLRYKIKHNHVSITLGLFILSFFLHRVGLFLYLLSASKKWQWVSKVKEKKLKLKKMPTHTQFFSENWEETLFNIVRDIVSLLCKYLWLLVTSELLEKLTPDRFWKDMVVERGKIELQNPPLFFFSKFCLYSSDCTVYITTNHNFEALQNSEEFGQRKMKSFIDRKY